THQHPGAQQADRVCLRFASHELRSEPLTTSFFLFKEPRAPQDLHSFPTRRSSDLIKVDNAIGCIPSTRRSKMRPAATAAAVPIRSEEHTSELQSLGQLVCRLLLEKKNTYHLPISTADAIRLRSCPIHSSD